MSKKKRKKPFKITKKKALGFLGAIMSGVLAITGSVLKEQISDIITILLKDSYINYTGCFPYWKADDYATPMGRYVAYYDNFDYNKGDNIFFRACAIHSNITNPKDGSVIIDKIQTKILSVKVNDEAEIVFYGGVRGNLFRIYAVNNGWGKSDLYNIDFFLVGAEKKDFQHQGWTYYGKHSFDEICDKESVLNQFSLLPGKIIKVAEYVLNPQRISSLDKSDYALYYRLSNGTNVYEDYWKFANDDNCPMILSYAPDFGFHLSDYTSMGGEDPDPGYAFEYFAELDVDKPTSLITYIGPDAIRRVDGNSNYHISTVLAPTKSCSIQCQTLAVIGGKAKKGEVMDIRIKVPIYSEIVVSGLIMRAVNEDWSEKELLESLDQHRYNIRQIFVENS